MKSTTKLLLIGFAVVVPAYFLLGFWTGELPATGRRGYAEYAARTEKETGWAPVQLFWEAPAEIETKARVEETVRFTLINGEAFSDGTHVPREKIREFLNLRVAAGEIYRVIVFPNKGARFKEIIPVLDECRKSRVRVVLLNQY